MYPVNNDRVVRSGTATASAVAPAIPASDAYEKQVQDAVLGSLSDAGGHTPVTFADMCQTIVVWACAITKIESDSPGSVDVTLAPEEVWIDKWDGSRDWYVFGEKVARSVCNFAQAGGVTSLGQVDVMQANGEIAYLSNW